MSDPTPVPDAEDKGDAPKLHRQTFICPFCGAFTGQDWAPLWTQVGNFQHFMQGGGLGQFNSAKCTKCHKSSVWLHETMIFPQRSTAPVAHGEMPDDVSELYNEAAAVLPHSRRAAAALVRASLERLLKGLDPDAPKGTKLFGYIDRVQGKVSGHLGQLLTLIRHVGNTALHEGANDDDESVQMFLDGEDASYIEMLFEATNYVVDELISRPKLVSKMYGKLPASVREAAEKAAAKSAATEK